MNINQFFSGIDTTIFAISIGYFGIYIGIYFSLIERVGDLKRIKKKSILHLYSNRKDDDIVRFIDFLYCESKILVLPAERSDWKFKTANIILFVISIIGMHIDPINNIVETHIAKDIILYLYSASLAIAALMLWFEVQYFLEFSRIEKKYFQ